jgi:hypothetical protein
MAIGIISAVIAVLAGSVCKSGSTFNLSESLAAPFQFFTGMYYVMWPAAFVVAFIVLPFTRSTCWSLRGVATLVTVPVGIYAIFGGIAAYGLYKEPQSGCI